MQQYRHFKGDVEKLKLVQAPDIFNNAISHDKDCFVLVYKGIGSCEVPHKVFETMLLNNQNPFDLVALLKQCILETEYVEFEEIK